MYLSHIHLCFIFNSTSCINTDFTNFKFYLLYIHLFLVFSNFLLLSGWRGICPKMDKGWGLSDISEFVIVVEVKGIVAILVP